MCLFSPFGVPQTRAASLPVIGEVAWAGSTLSTADEWLELWNLGSADLSIGGYSLVGATANPLVFPQNAVIPAHSAYLISNYDASNTKSVLASAPHYVTTDVALSNSTLQIILRDPSGIEIDRAGSGGLPPAGQSGTPKASMIRSGDVWATATASVGFDADRTELGTPGFCDGCVAMAADPPPLEQPPVPTESPTTTSTPDVSPPTTPDPLPTTSTPPIILDPINATTVEILPPADQTVTDTQPAATSTPTEPASPISPPTVAPADPSTDTTTTVPTDVPTTTDPLPVLPPQPDTPVIVDAVVEIIQTTSSADEATTTMDTSTDPAPSQTEPIPDQTPPAEPIASLDASATEIVAQDMSMATESAPTSPDPSAEIILPSTSTTSPADLVASTTTVDAIASSSEPTTQTSAETQVVLSTTPAVPRYDFLRLNEILPNPSSGHEWIEITSIEPGIAVLLDGIQLHDAAGKITTIATGTIDTITPFFVFSLSSSRLNNSGDSVLLKDPSGQTIDELTYHGSTAGVSWARSPDGDGAWQESTTPTPGAGNNIPAPQANTESTTSTAANASASQTTSASSSAAASAQSVTPSSSATGGGTATLPTSLPTLTPVIASVTSTKRVDTTLPETKTMTKPTPTPKSTPPKTISQTKKETPPAVATTSTPKKTSTTTTKTTPKKSSSQTTPTYLPLTIPMTTSEDYRGIRVTLEGTVGSPSGLLTGHGFVLLSPDGRGLVIHVPTAQKLPTLGDHVRVNGTLAFDDAGIPSISFKTNDSWTKESSPSTTPSPRSADLFTPSAEDAWSLVSVTGTVLTVKSGTVTISVDGADVNVAIRKVVEYRTARLSVGDTIRVTGLLDASNDVPRVLPRLADEIVLSSHVPSPKTADRPLMPGWAPFGAAGLAIAGTEGVKHLNNRRKRRSLEKILETGLNDEEKQPV